jgi:hypothetical protein
MSQKVTVTGMGNDTFNNAIIKINEIIRAFSDFHGSGKFVLLKSTEFEVAESAHPSLPLGNRFFCHRAAAIGPAIPFSSEIDPHGYLASQPNGLLRHTQDNEVEYFRLESEDGDGYKR